MKDHQDKDRNAGPRREIMLGGLAVFASMFVFFNPFKSTPKKTDKIKMLSEDGKLVEIDASVIERSRKRKVSKEELQDWVKEK